MKRYIYLATPHYHENKSIMAERERAAVSIATRLVANGLRLFCAIAHSKDMPKHSVGKEITHSEFLLLDAPLLYHSDMLIVVCMDGWEKSEGIKKEVIAARMQKKPIFLLFPDDNKNWWEF